MTVHACSRSSPSRRRALTSLVRPFTVTWASGFASRFTTHTGCFGPPKFEPAISHASPRGTASSGVDLGRPLFRPMTVSLTLGSPAMSSTVSRPLVSHWMALSVAVICGSSLGMNDSEPTLTATGVSRPMRGRLEGGRRATLRCPSPGCLGPRDRFLLLGRELLLRGPALDVLRVGAGVAAARDRREHDAVAPLVGKGERPRQPASHVAEGVVADQREVPQRALLVGAQPLDLVAQ